jgi:nucleotide-binding universal stress UspA family protein
MTPIRKILLPLNGTATGRAALATALVVARQFGAHVTALHVSADCREVAPLAGEGLSGAMVEEMMSAAERESGQRSRDVRRAFEEFVLAHDVPVGDLRVDENGPSASLETIVGREDDVVAQAARLADLAVVPHPDATDLSSSDALHAVLFDSGRPVLVAPKLEPATIGSRVAIAWNGSAESATAVLACMPWLTRAGSVRVLHADEYQRRGPQAHELLAYLRLHGVEADTAKFKPIDREVGAGLLAAARAFDADLLCQGAYSHSRLRQLILGGVTRHVLEHAHLPVLMCR